MHRNTLSRTIAELKLDAKALRNGSAGLRAARILACGKKSRALTARQPGYARRARFALLSSFSDTSGVVHEQKKRSGSSPLLKSAIRSNLLLVRSGVVYRRAVETGLPFLSSNTPSVMVIMNGLGV